MMREEKKPYEFDMQKKKKKQFIKANARPDITNNLLFYCYFFL